ncbi:MAG: hypothetical protein VR77_00675 [Flavobacteriales bacterium BRH_c54]|nr:MAG: hypothetical protein VR77_00675 [Flavobacteriales bacterium BRH_c54]
MMLFAQEDMRPSGAKKASGMFELGVRNTFSTFGATENLGVGFGGQFRIRVSNRINTEWFADFINEDIDGLATRNDYHIGWSVMIYPFKDKAKLVPYVLAGHCFDYTKVRTIYTIYASYPLQTVSRLSSATQVGIGTHINLSEIVDISLSSQYMIHLGSDVHAETHEHNGVKEVHIAKEGHSGFSLEGHLLFTLSVNFKIAQLW